MATIIGNHGQLQAKRRRRNKAHARQTLQKPNGTVGPRVKKVGADKFALVCVDPAKQRSEWMMADYFGNLLNEPRTLGHQAGHFDAAVQMIRHALGQHGVQDPIVARRVSF